MRRRPSGVGPGHIDQSEGAPSSPCPFGALHIATCNLKIDVRKVGSQGSLEVEEVRLMMKLAVNALESYMSLLLSHGLMVPSIRLVASSYASLIKKLQII